MRVGYVVLASMVTLLAIANALPATTDSTEKKTFTITSPESNNTLDGVYVQRGGKKFLILHLDETPITQKTGDDDSSSNEDASASDGQEERSPVSAGTTTMLKKPFSGNYDNILNRLVRQLFLKMTPKDRRLPDPPRIPARLRPRPFKKVDG
ncbi:hypothetical protein PRIC2_011988 [Phytophthora ramorum]